MTKETLAANLIRYVVADSQRYLCIWYDLARECLLLKYFGHDVEKLPEVRPELFICYHKMVDTPTIDQRVCSFHAFFDNKRYVVTASYTHRRRLIELRLEKTNITKRCRDLFDHGLFPLTL